MEAIILAGGEGSRLKPVISDVPKPMAPVHNRPFLEYILMWLTQFKITKLVLSTGYKAEVVRSYFGDNFRGIPVEYSYECEPLGTGGGILRALNRITGENIAVVNGDTWFPVDLDILLAKHLSLDGGITLAMKLISESDRYGSVMLANDGTIKKFLEKQFLAEGFINGGIYMLRKSYVLGLDLPEKFSFERDVLEKVAVSGMIKGVVFSDPFLDIGIPEDYGKAELVL